MTSDTENKHWETEVRILGHSHTFRHESEEVSMHSLIQYLVAAGLNEGTLVDLTTMRLRAHADDGLPTLVAEVRGTRRTS